MSINFSYNKITLVLAISVVIVLSLPSAETNTDYGTESVAIRAPATSTFEQTNLMSFNHTLETTLAMPAHYPKAPS